MPIPLSLSLAVSLVTAVAPFALHTDGTRLKFRIATGDCVVGHGAWAYWEPNIVIPGFDPYPRNVWIDFVFHIKFEESATGIVQVYARTGSNPWPSTPQIARSGIPTMPFYSAGNVHNVHLYWETGLYPGYAGYSGNDAIYIDDFRRESSLAAAEGGSTGPTQPSTTPTTPPPAGGAPVSSAAPSTSGTLTVGQVLTASNSTWSGSPTGYAYQWQYFRDQGSTWLDIPGGDCEYVPGGLHLPERRRPCRGDHHQQVRVGDCRQRQDRSDRGIVWPGDLAARGSAASSDTAGPGGSGERDAAANQWQPHGRPVPDHVERLLVGLALRVCVPVAVHP